ncbi:MAG: hypothetical protein AAGI22_17065 [Planctomycetota bacterium]
MARSLALIAALVTAVALVLVLTGSEGEVEPAVIARDVPAPARLDDGTGPSDAIAPTERIAVEAPRSTPDDGVLAEAEPEAAPSLLARHGTVVVALTREDGSPPGDGWMGVARTVMPLASGLSSIPVVVEPFDAEAGICVLEGVEPGMVEVRAERDLAQSIKADPLQLEAGATVDLTLVMGNGRSGSTVDVAFRLPPFSGLLRHLRRQAQVTAGLLDGARVVATLDGRPVAAPGDGPFTVRMEDPRFEPVTLQGVRPGEPVVLDLVGSAAVRLEVVTADGERWDEYDVDVEMIGALGGGDLGGRIRWASQPLPDGGRFALPPGLELELSVDAGARGEASARIEPLENDEERTMRITLPAGRFLVDVDVTRGTPPGPASGVLVALVQGAVGPQSQEARSLSFALIRASTSEARHERIHHSSWTDDDGRVQLGAPADVAGPWSVCAHVGGVLMVAPVVGHVASLHVGGVGELVVEFTGVPAGVAFPPSNVRLLARAPYRDGRSVSLDRGDVPLAPSSGGYRAEAVPSGPRAVVLDDVSRSIPRPSGQLSQWHELTLAEVEVVESRTTRVRIDAGPFLGASLAAVVRVDGEPREGLVVRAIADGSGAFAAVPAARPGFTQESSVTTDADGLATFEWLPPSTWTLAVMDEQRGWRSSSDLDGAQVTLTPAESATTELDVVFHAGRVVVREASSGAALGEQRLILVPGAYRSMKSVRPVPVETDPDGAAELDLPTGRYGLLRGDTHPYTADPENVLFFDWPLPDEAGGVLRMPPAR